jgi:hypothetical protein
MTYPKELMAGTLAKSRSGCIKDRLSRHFIQNRFRAKGRISRESVKKAVRV